MDPDQRNLVGSLDRFVLNLAMALLCVFPTLADLVLRPWRIAPLLKTQLNEGRKGPYLGPGVFFIASITLFTVLASFTVTAETLASNTSLIGPAFAQRIGAAVRDGEAWQVAGLIAPFFGVAALFGAIIYAVGYVSTERWTLPMALGASLFQMATTICWIIATSALIDQLAANTAGGLATRLYDFNTLPIILIPGWQFFWFFRVAGSNSIPRAFGLAAAALVLCALPLIALQILSRLS